MMTQIGVYFLLDVSASMYGLPLQIMYESYDYMARSLSRYNHPFEFSVLAYESQLIEICRHQPYLPPLAPIPPAGASRLGMALAQVCMWLNTDLDRLSHALLILIADEVGNDNWSASCRLLDKLDKRTTLIAISCQYSTNLETLCHMARVFNLKKQDELEIWLKQFMGSRH